MGELPLWFIPHEDARMVAEELRCSVPEALACPPEMRRQARIAANAKAAAQRSRAGTAWG